MTQRYMLKIAKKHNIDNVDEVIDACEFVEELLKEVATEMILNDTSDNITQCYMDANWAVGDLVEEIEVMEKGDEE